MKTPMTHTRNTLPEMIRSEMIALLQLRLADSIDLMMQAKQAHWNVKGPHFIALHRLFDQVFTDCVKYVDTVAERVVQLGGLAHGTVRATSEASTLPPYPVDISCGRKHVAALAHSIAYYSELIRDAIQLATKVGDPLTADLFTEISRGVDVNLWFVEAHEQEEA
jgi:starvation-inducible DNA-binding protein